MEEIKETGEIKETDEIAQIPYYLHEREMERADRRLKWVLWFAAGIFVALIVTNIGWIVYESQYEDVVTNVTQETSTEASGDAILNGNNAGAVIYGVGETDSND